VRAVVQRAGGGHVEIVDRAATEQLHLPAGRPATAYRWLEFDSASGFGVSSIAVTDQPDRADPAHIMIFQTLPRAGHAVFLRVGSCIQWHGYSTTDLHLVLHNAPADMSVKLLP